MFLGAPVNRHAAKQGTTYSNRDGEFLNHLQKKDIHKDTATVPASINKVQNWHSIPSDSTSYCCSQSWVTLGHIGSFTAAKEHCLWLCSLPRAMPCINVLSSKILTRTQMQKCHHHHSKYSRCWQNSELFRDRKTERSYFTSVSRDKWNTMYSGVFSEH